MSYTVCFYAHVTHFRTINIRLRRGCSKCRLTVRSMNPGRIPLMVLRTSDATFTRSYLAISSSRFWAIRRTSGSGSFKAISANMDSALSLATASMRTSLTDMPALFRRPLKNNKANTAPATAKAIERAARTEPTSGIRCNQSVIDDDRRQKEKSDGHDVRATISGK